ncbi:hypothetical protein ABPG75_003664 [Micractinium tetrahymenae]
MVGIAPSLLAIDTSVWQTALAVMQLCGLTQAEALKVGRNNAKVLINDWLATDRLVNQLALQRCLPGGLSAAQVYERHAGYVASHSAEWLAGRLLFLQQHGLLHLLVPQKKELLQEWRQENGFRADMRPPGEPPLISLRDVGKLTGARFASLPAVQAAGGLSALRAFQRGLKSSSAWLELQAAAAEEQARLLPLLPEDLRQATEKRQQAAEQCDEEEE